MNDYYLRFIGLRGRLLLKQSASFILVLCMAVMMNLQANAQSRSVSGKITDETGSGLPGVTVVVKGTSQGTVTDIEGSYKINVDSDEAVLVASFVGYKSQEQVVGSRSVLDFPMELDVEQLEEVVVVGYGEIRKANLTAAQTSISSESIGRTVNTTLDQAMQGRSAGVYVTQNTGAPGGGVSVNIRGVNSINGSNEPLYVIDGLQIDVGSTSLNGSNPLSSLNPNDIASIDILQGPNATAIYGSRGTNGVVLITTKSGKAGDTKITYGYTYSLQDKPEELDVLNLREYAQLQLDIRGEDGDIQERFEDPTLLGDGTNWQRELFKRAAMHQHQLSFSGGTEVSRYRLSAERMSQDGVAPNSGFDRTSLRLKADTKPTDYLKLGANVMVAQTDQKQGTLAADGSPWNNLILNALNLAPDIPVRNLDGSFGGGNPDIDDAQQFAPVNPIALGSLVTNDEIRRNLQGGVSAAVKVYDGLEVQTNFTTNVGVVQKKIFYPTFEISPYQLNRSAQLTNESNVNTYWSWNQTVSYVKDFGKHQLNAMVTHESQYSDWRNLKAGRQDFETNEVTDLNVGDAASASNSGGQGEWAMESYLGRINYSFDDRYIVTLAYRADGSVNFASDNRWGYFPSASVAYRLSNESFFQFDPISDLRLRYETGITGNQGSGGGIFGSLNSGPSAWGTAFYPQRFPNPAYQWEETVSNNYGITLGLLGGRVQIDADYYIKETDNLILESSLPWYLGTSGQSAINPPFVNVGSLENKGWSIALNAKIINTSSFQWEIDANISGYKTEITSLTTETGQVNRELGNGKGNNPFFQRTVVGSAPWQFVGLIQDGVFVDLDDVTNSARPVDGNDEPLAVGENSIWVGDAKYRDISGPDGVPDGKINEFDLTFIGDPNPELFGGVTNRFSYKGISLSIFLQGNYGNDVYNLTKDATVNPNNFYLGRNMSSVSLDYAQINTDNPDAPYVTNPTTSVPRPHDGSLNNNFDRYTSTYVEDGSYLRLKNVTLSYTLPEKWLASQNIVRAVRLGVSGQNLYTWTNYTGYDPEVGSYVGESFNGDVMQGLDYGRYPLTPVYSFNLGIDF